MLAIPDDVGTGRDKVLPTIPDDVGAGRDKVLIPDDVGAGRGEKVLLAIPDDVGAERDKVLLTVPDDIGAGRDKVFLEISDGLSFPSACSAPLLLLYDTSNIFLPLSSLDIPLLSDVERAENRESR